MRWGGLLEVTHFWQLIVPGKDKRGNEKTAFCGSAHHFQTKLLSHSHRKEGMGVATF